MPMHDWTRVESGIFHAFHHRWISAISDVLNLKVLPKTYYALSEQITTGFGPDVLTLQGGALQEEVDPSANGGGIATVTALRTRPRTRFVAEFEAEFYRRKKMSVAIRHVSGDRIVAVIEIVFFGNKAGQKPFQAFIDKAYDLLERRIHLLIIDPFPPTPRDPNGFHDALWQQIAGVPFEPPADKPLTLVAYECDLLTRAYIEPFAVGDPLPEMPLFLEPDGCVMVPLEATYQDAFAVMPERWRRVLRQP